MMAPEKEIKGDYQSFHSSFSAEHEYLRHFNLMIPQKERQKISRSIEINLHKTYGDLLNRC